MKRRAAFLVVLAMLAALPASAPSQPPQASAGQVALHQIQQDIAVAGLLQGLQAQGRHRVTLLRNVRIVDPDSGRATAGQSVIVAGGRIHWVGETAQAPRLRAPFVIEGRGRFLAPALADMHIHSGRAGGWLLNLAAGVTTVRDMAGMNWILRARDAVGAGRMLAPTLYVAGPLINASPVFGYAVVPANALDARRLVRQQAACGYDFVKVHNDLPRPTFDMVAAQARLEGMALIGHVPHDIPVGHAAAAGMRTMEHLKGWLDDRTLGMGERDYAAAARPGLWVTPTLYATVQNLHGDPARAALRRPQMAYVPLVRRRRWQAAIDAPAAEPGLRAARDNALGNMVRIVQALHAAGARFLAGTDNDYYAHQVMGFGLLEELDMLRAAGLSPAEVYRAATSEAARALGEEAGMGAVRPGMRADLLLLDANPAQDPAALRGGPDVMAQGVWLERQALNGALAALARLYAEPDEATAYGEAQVEAAAAAVERLAADGFVLDASALTALAAAARGSGWTVAAERIERVAAVPTSGPCYEVRPE
jgi:imidazolonepropionase-like amidohydrolase